MTKLVKTVSTVARAGLTVGAIALGSNAFAAACLLNSTDPVGNGVFGATVGTFEGLGIVAGDGTMGTACIENGLWATPSNFGLGSYLKGADGFGTGTNNTVLGAYDGSGSFAANANALDHAWVQDTSVNASPGGATGSGPSTGIIWDLGGQANQLAVFVFVDHGPVPDEVLENTAWLSNDPNAADAGWTQAKLVHVYGAGWDADPVISDGFVAVYQLPTAATFRYASVTWGGPGAVLRDNDNEIDAVGGLTFDGGGVINTPEPAPLAVLAAAALGLVLRRRRTA